MPCNRCYFQIARFYVSLAFFFRCYSTTTKHYVTFCVILGNNLLLFSTLLKTFLPMRLSNISFIPAREPLKVWKHIFTCLFTPHSFLNCLCKINQFLFCAVRNSNANFFKVWALEKGYILFFLVFYSLFIWWLVKHELIHWSLGFDCRGTAFMNLVCSCCEIIVLLHIGLMQFLSCSIDSSLLYYASSSFLIISKMCKLNL